MAVILFYRRQFSLLTCHSIASRDRCLAGKKVEDGGVGMERGRSRGELVSRKHTHTCSSPQMIINDSVFLFD